MYKEETPQIKQENRLPHLKNEHVPKKEKQ